MYRYCLFLLMMFALPVQALQKQALVIGNGAYPDKWALSNPVNDANDVAAALENLGFKVTLLTDGNKRRMSSAVQNFASGLQNGDVALFYFSGHGFSGKDPNTRDTNFLVGSFQEAVRTREALEDESIDANFVVRSLKNKNAQGINVMILDACRNVPSGFLEEHKGTFEEGLVSLGKYERFIMNYATQPLKKALGSKNQRNSVYTQYLVQGLNDAALTHKNITEFFNDVGLLMADAFGDKQTPLVEMSPVRFCFAGCGGVVQQVPVVAAPAAPPAPEEDVPPAPAPKPARQAYEPEMVKIPAGTFDMGSEDGYSYEKPVHAWKMGAFYMSKYETTFEEYDAFASATGRSKPDDNGWGRGKRPVIGVSWNDAVAYAEWLSKKTGKNYRLPTEAEWEYAARGGSTTKYWWGDNIGSNKANCDGCGSQWDNKQTAPVGSFLPNGFGLYDTAGNVWEWTCSEYGTYSDKKETVCNQVVSGQRVLRGGSWFGTANYVRSASRSLDDTSSRPNYLGLRLILSP